jgi:hypothetical protein
MKPGLHQMLKRIQEQAARQELQSRQGCCRHRVERGLGLPSFLSDKRQNHAQETRGSLLVLCGKSTHAQTDWGQSKQVDMCVCVPICPETPGSRDTPEMILVPLTTKNQDP